MTGPELRAALKGYDASTLLEHSHYYQQYIQKNLLEQVPTDPAEVNLSTSYLFFLFSLCCSSIADEVMDEQADTRRTEIEMTDQETKHASHTYYTMPARGEASTNAVTSLYLIGYCTTRLMRYRFLLNSRCTLTHLSFLASLLLMLLLSCTLKTLILNVSSRVFIQR